MPGHNKDNKSQKKLGFSSINPLKRFKTQKRDTMENEKKRKKRPKNYHFGRKKKKWLQMPGHNKDNKSQNN